MFTIDDEKIITNLKSYLPQVKLIYLFGSYANGTQTKQSDLDIAVLLDAKLDNVTRWNIAQSLASAWNIDVDLIDLANASTVLCQQVVTQGRLIWGSVDEDDLFAVKTISMYQHLQEERALILNELALDETTPRYKDRSF